MNRVTLCLLLLLFLSPGISIAAPPQNNGPGGAVKIHTLADLKSAVNSPSFRDAIMDMNSWLPDVVSSLEWQTRMSRHFILLYAIDSSDEDDALFETFLDASENIYSQLEDFFGIRADAKQERLALKTRLVCIVVKTQSERTFGSLPDPHHLFYLLDAKRDPEYMEKFRHEFAHWMWGRLYGEAPSLFNEGVAVYAEKMSAPGAKTGKFTKAAPDIGALPPLSELAFNENFWKPGGTYTAGGLFIRYLVERHGWQPLKRFFLLSEFEDGKVLEHFREAYGMELTEADRDWRESLRSNAPSGKSNN